MHILKTDGLSVHRYCIGDNTGWSDINKAVGRRTAVSGSRGTAGIHDVDPLLIGTQLDMGMPVQGDVTVLLLGRLYQRAQVIVYPIAVAVCGKDPVSGSDIQGHGQGALTAIVAVAFDVVEAGCNIRKIIDQLPEFLLAVAQMNKGIGLEIAQYDGAEGSVPAVCIRNDNNTHIKHLGVN